MISYNNLRDLNYYQIAGRLWRVTGGGVTFTAISAAGNVDLFTDTAVLNDALYFSVGLQCNKFLGVQFNVATAIVSVAHTLAFEYRKKDGTWAAVPGLVDNTNEFRNLGVNSITWTLPSDWGSDATSIAGYNGLLWFRIRISAVTTLTEGGKQANTPFKIYDNAVSIEAGHEFDFGTASYGASKSLTNSTKAYATDILKNRAIFIHTGTGAGQMRRIKSNTATVIWIFGAWDTIPDNTSQYSVCANFQDIYDADVAGGWGVVTKAGKNCFGFSCYLEFRDCSFGDFHCMVDFISDLYFYNTVAFTNRNRLYLGYRLPIIYGLDKAIWGNMIASNRESTVDTRGFGVSQKTQYAFLAGNTFILKHSHFLTGDGYIRAWFINGGATDINNRYEGWRSCTWPNTTNKTEVRKLEVAENYSGIETPYANFSDVESFYNAGLALFVTGNIDFAFDEFNLGLDNDEQSGNIFGSPMQFYSYTAVNTKYSNRKGLIFRPMNDSYAAGSNGISYPQNTIRMNFVDEFGQIVNNVRVVGINTIGTVLFDVLSGGANEFLNAQAVSSGGAYSLSSQPAFATKLRLTVSNFTDNSTSISLNARIILTGTDKNGVVIKELIFLENVGNGIYETNLEFLTVTASKIETAGWTGTLSIDRGGAIYPQSFEIEKWQSTDDTNLTVVNYNPFTFVISRPGFEPLKLTQTILRDKELTIVLKRSNITI